MQTLRAMRTALGFSVIVAASAGCATVCDEVADEAEAGGCALGVLPSDDEDTNEELATCEGEHEARSECLLNLTQNVCAITEEESVELAACYEAARNPSQ